MREEYVTVMGVISWVGIVALAALFVFSDSPASQDAFVGQERQVVIDDPRLAAWVQGVSADQPLAAEDMRELARILEDEEDYAAQLLVQEIRSPSRTLYGLAACDLECQLRTNVMYDDGSVFYTTSKYDFGVGDIGKGYGVTVRIRIN